ncbi:MAG: cyclic nucleotide-binding/CBS domain-containing protein [Candidatus Aquirickettsiella gammari]
MNKPISSMMTRQTKTVTMDTSVAQVEQLMRQSAVSALPVVENKTENEIANLVGIISAKDLMRFHHSKRDANAISAWEICTYKPIATSADTDIGVVAKLMVDNGVHHIVIIENNQIVGIVSALDFVRRHIE